MPPVFVLTLKAKRLSFGAAPRLVVIANKPTSKVLRFIYLFSVEVDSIEDVVMSIGVQTILFDFGDRRDRQLQCVFDVWIFTVIVLR